MMEFETTDLEKLALCYEKGEPCVITGGAIFEADEIYQAFLERCNSYRRDLIPEPGKFFVSGEQITQGLERHLPRESERQLADYLRRVDADYRGKETLCYGYDFRDQSDKVRQKMADFLDQFYTQVTRRPKETFIELFMGSYRMTAGGIHKETAANFQMVLYGHKTMTVWPEATWKENREVADHVIDNMSGNAECYLPEIGMESANDVRQDLVGRPGDLIYWPENWWHVGHSVDFTLSVTIPLYF